MEKASLIIMILSSLVAVMLIKGSEEHPSRYIYPTKLFAEDLVVTSDSAQALSDCMQHPQPNGTLVLVPAGTNLYHYAIIQYQFLDGKSVYTLNLKKNVHEMHATQNIRALKLIPKLIYQPNPPKDFFVTFFHALVNRLSEEQEPQLTAKIIPPDKHIVVIGDLHGDARALRHIVSDLYINNILSIDGILAPDRLIVFTGDLTDRGPRGPEVWDIVLALKSLNPEQVFIVKGNHETTAVADYGNFILQMKSLTDCSKAFIMSSLKKLFSHLPLCLLLGVAPQPRKDAPEIPYRFLMFCHGGIDPIINIKRLMQLLIQKHRRCNEDTLSLPVHHHNPDSSGLLWTDFRTNYSDNEPATRTASTRGEGIHLFNSSAVMDFFDEHISKHPQHPYILDGLVRGHQHIDGIGRLRMQAEPGKDWYLMNTEETEIIQPASIYTCTSSTKWVWNRDDYRVSYADISFNSETRQWILTPYIAYGKKQIN